MQKAPKGPFTVILLSSKEEQTPSQPHTGNPRRAKQVQIVAGNLPKHDHQNQAFKAKNSIHKTAKRQPLAHQGQQHC